MLKKEDWMQIKELVEKVEMVREGGNDNLTRWDICLWNRDEAGLFFRLLSIKALSTGEKSSMTKYWQRQYLTRLLHHCTTLNIKGESYRLKEKRKAGILGLSLKPQEAKTIRVVFQGWLHGS